MNFEETIDDIRKNLREGRFRNESEVSQGIVVRILRELGWPDHDTHVVCPQYSVRNLKVDFALCDPPNKPKVFVEVKRVGVEEGHEQLFNYAFHVGVPMAILTNGQEWTFFLPIAAGDHEERRLYKLDILEREIKESVRILQKYLNYEDWCSGKAYEIATEDHRDISQRQVAKRNMSRAWSSILSDCDVTLMDLLRDEVEKLCGHTPRQEDIEEFLRNKTSSRISTPSPSVGGKSSDVFRPLKQRQISCGFILRGKNHATSNPTEAFIKIFEIFTQDSDFVDRFMAIKHGRKRRWLSLDREDLFPGRSDLQEQYTHKLDTGYWIGKNESTNTYKKIIEKACEIAGENDLQLMF